MKKLQVILLLSTVFIFIFCSCGSPKKTKRDSNIDNEDTIVTLKGVRIDKLRSEKNAMDPKDTLSIITFVDSVNKKEYEVRTDFANANDIAIRYYFGKPEIVDIRLKKGSVYVLQSIKLHFPTPGQ